MSDASIALGMWVLMGAVLYRATADSLDPSADQTEADVTNAFVAIGLVLWMKFNVALTNFLAGFEKHQSHSATDLSILQSRFVLEAIHYCIGKHTLTHTTFFARSNLTDVLCCGWLCM